MSLPGKKNVMKCGILFKSFIICVLYFNAQCLHKAKPYKFDGTTIGVVKWKDGLGRISVGIADVLRNRISLNHRCTKPECDLSDFPLDKKQVLYYQDPTPGRVGLLTSQLWTAYENNAALVPEECIIKIAYSMIESTAIPDQWVSILNSSFDLVLVPDDFSNQVYNACGVKIPVFTLPHGIYLESLLKEPIKERPSDPFTFGLSATIDHRKNQKTLIEAFHAEFKNDPGVKLKLHGRWGSNYYKKEVRDLIKSLNATNISVAVGQWSDEECYEFMKSLDCYVLLSRGEGFSVTPREALSLGIPCIITNNTAHKTICETGYVYPVPSLKKVPAFYGNFFGKANCGFQFECSVEDARKALREVYSKYPLYKAKAIEGRKWAEQYTWQNLSHKFLNVFKPKKVLIGNENILTDEYLMTTSQKLYDKYKQVIGA